MVQPVRECFFYNHGNNLNFTYHCPLEYGARCEFYDKFFSAYTFDVETKQYLNLNPDCSKCSEERKKGLEERIE
jgi:hypothetical protein